MNVLERGFPRVLCFWGFPTCWQGYLSRELFIVLNASPGTTHAMHAPHTQAQRMHGVRFAYMRYTIRYNVPQFHPSRSLVCCAWVVWTAIEPATAVGIIHFFWITRHRACIGHHAHERHTRPGTRYSRIVRFNVFSAVRGLCGHVMSLQQQYLQ